jgi:VWFA-related protein
MTDGVDTNSQQSLADVIALAQKAEVPVYTLGVGQPGKLEPVTTALVLDCSGSMNERAEEGDRMSKIEALKRSASRFVDLMRPGARTTLFPFNRQIRTSGGFTDDKADLKRKIATLEARDQTVLFDAIEVAARKLKEANPPGKRAVVVLTDGRDEGSRLDAEAAVEAARTAKVPLHLIGIGRPGELDEPIMRQMAEATGGTYHHARNQRSLYEIFEDLAIQLHDDGIDEVSLQQLAEQTGGTYFPAHDVTKLQFAYEQFAEELQDTYTVTFPSRRPISDGTARRVEIAIRRGGALVSGEASGDYAVRGVVVPEMSGKVYLGFLAVLGGLLALPPGLRRLYRLYGGH